MLQHHRFRDFFYNALENFGVAFVRAQVIRLNIK